MFFDLAANGKALLIFGKLGVIFGKFLLAGFYGKIGLTGGDDIFARVTVHHNQIAGVSGKHIAGKTAFCARTDGNHLGGVTEMVGNIIATVFASIHSFENTLLKVAKILIFESFCQLTCVPEFLPVFVDVLDRFKNRICIFFYL